MQGEKNPAWRGGRSSSNGYVVVRIEGRYILEHRWVMAQHLGRPLLSFEQVHHRNKDKSDNRIENLELTTLTEHGHLHRGEWHDVACDACGTTFAVQPYRLKRNNHFFCSRGCAAELPRITRCWEARWGVKTNNS